MKIAHFKREINPEPGAYIAGYSLNDKSVGKVADLYMSGLCADDGVNKVLIISFDLLGMDEWYTRALRQKCADILGITAEAVLFTCTHTHSGPESRTLGRSPQQLNKPYLEKLEKAILEETEKLTDFKECSVYFYSQKCDENRNRRYITPCNNASFTAHRREVLPIALEYADKELGQLIFINSETRLPEYVIGNYAAHALAGHGPGIGGRRISPDYPGFFRDYVTSETGADCMFISGAAGDLIPKEDELGTAAAVKMGENLGKAALAGMCDAPRNPARFLMKEAKVGAKSKIVTVPLRKKKVERLSAYYEGREALDLEIQIVSIGDCCFIGVPGELCCEIGQEMKWHSPFRKAWIAYNSTAYLSYIGHANMLVSGGYEGGAQYFTARGGLALVNTAVDAMFELHDELYPQEDGDIYPDNHIPQLVNIPANR